MLHHGNHAPVPTILKPVAGIKFEMSSFCAKKLRFLSLNICYVLCSIVNKILAHVIESLLVFILFKFKKRPNISGIRVVNNYLNMLMTLQ